MIRTELFMLVAYRIFILLESSLGTLIVLFLLLLWFKPNWSIYFQSGRIKFLNSATVVGMTCVMFERSGLKNSLGLHSAYINENTVLNGQSTNDHLIIRLCLGKSVEINEQNLLQLFWNSARGEFSNITNTTLQTMQSHTHKSIIISEQTSWSFGKKLFYELSIKQNHDF